MAVADPIARAGRRPIIVWDLVLTIALLLVGTALAASFAFFGVFIAFISDSCGASSTCNSDTIATGLMVGVAAPIGLFVIAIVGAIIQLVRRRIAFWIPIVGAVLSGLGLVAGFLIAGSGVSGFFAQ